MSGDFDSRKNTQSTKLEQRPQILVKLSFREFSDSKLSGLIERPKRLSVSSKILITVTNFIVYFAFLSRLLYFERGCLLKFIY